MDSEHKLYLSAHHHEEAKFHLGLKIDFTPSADFPKEYHHGRVAVRGHQGKYLTVTHEQFVQAQENRSHDSLWEEIFV